MLVWGGEGEAGGVEGLEGGDVTPMGAVCERVWCGVTVLVGHRGSVLVGGSEVGVGRGCVGGQMGGVSRDIIYQAT